MATTTIDGSHDDAPPQALIPLTAYRPPALPADERFKVAFAKVRAMFGTRSGSAFIADEQLKQATLRRLNRAVAPPAAGPVLAQIDASVRDWLAGPPTAERLKAIVVPPCDSNDVVGSWARQQGHAILTRDTRGGDHDALFATLADIDPDTLVVIPQLEAWFLRTPDGLEPIRALIALLDRRRQRCVIGCNSWGWAFLAKAVGIDLLVGAPLTFAPFNGAGLRDWFGDLARDDRTQGTRFRLVQGGVAILSDEAGERATDFFATLAGRSRGIPWVAWYMWRRMLRTEGDDSVTGEEEETLWIAALEELVLPGDQPREALLVLHALALHGHLTTAELRAVLPIVGESTVPAALVASGFLDRDGDTLRLRAEAYPAIRDGLNTAGLPVGAI